MPKALLRDIPDSFARAIVREGGRAPVVELARDQHALYLGRLQEAGYETQVLTAEEDHPDCVFIEDTAVIVGSVAVVTRPGAATRRGETGAVAEVLSGLFPVVTMNAPGTLDGGDVMILADKVFVGRSGRTNTDGIDQLTRVASGQGMPVVVVPVEGVLHLKSAVLPVDGETVVVTPGTVDTSLLSDLRIVDEAEAERHGFSALPLASGEVLVTDGAPDTSSRLAALGMSIVPIDVSEIMAADGGLTCMSILY